MVLRKVQLSGEQLVGCILQHHFLGLGVERKFLRYSLWSCHWWRALLTWWVHLKEFLNGRKRERVFRRLYWPDRRPRLRWDISSATRCGLLTSLSCFLSPLLFHVSVVVFEVSEEILWAWQPLVKQYHKLHIGIMNPSSLTDKKVSDVWLWFSSMNYSRFSLSWPNIAKMSSRYCLICF